MTLSTAGREQFEREMAVRRGQDASFVQMVCATRSAALRERDALRTRNETLRAALVEVAPDHKALR